MMVVKGWWILADGCVTVKGLKGRSCEKGWPKRIGEVICNLRKSWCDDGDRWSKVWLINETNYTVYNGEVDWKLLSAAHHTHSNIVPII